MKHPWWHKIFERLYRIKSYRDGFLGDLTPDIDEEHYCCDWFKCKWEKIETKVLK